MPDGRNVIAGEQVILQNVSRKHQGVYECSGKNEEGEEFTDTVEVKVTCEKIFLLIKHLFLYNIYFNKFTRAEETFFFLQIKSANLKLSCQT